MSDDDAGRGPWRMFEEPLDREPEGLVTEETAIDQTLKLLAAYPSASRGEPGEPTASLIMEDMIRAAEAGDQDAAEYLAQLALLEEG